MRQAICRLAVVFAVLGKCRCPRWPRTCMSPRTEMMRTPERRKNPWRAFRRRSTRSAGPGRRRSGSDRANTTSKRPGASGAQHAGNGRAAAHLVRGTEPGRRPADQRCRTVGKFRLISADEANPPVPPEAKRHVLVADLAEQGFPPRRRCRTNIATTARRGSHLRRPADAVRPLAE